MSLPIVFWPEARGEYDGAVAWYEREVPGLGTRFEAAVEALLQAIADKPKRYPVARRDVREAPLSGFPYCVYYRVQAGRLVVLSVFHTSRDPTIWQSRA